MPIVETLRTECDLCPEQATVRLFDAKGVITPPPEGRRLLPKRMSHCPTLARQGPIQALGCTVMNCSTVFTPAETKDWEPAKLFDCSGARNRAQVWRPYASSRLV